MSDPNSYYHNIRKDEKVQIANVIKPGIEEDPMTADFPKINLEKQFTFNKNQSPIEPYIKEKPAATHPPIPSIDPSPSVPKDPQRTKSVDSRPVKKKKEPVQVTLPPAPKYEPLPCLDCKNIKSICDLLKISQIDEVIDLVAKNNNGGYFDN